MEKTSEESNAENLRKKAESRIKKNKTNLITQLSEFDQLKLIHELGVHQIELEMQNEELKIAKEQAFIALDKYIELYDLAPASYITLSTSGNIERITLAGAEMLGKERSNLFSSNFKTFVTQKTLPVFNNFFDKVFNSKNRETCQVTLTKADKSTIDVFIAGIISENGKMCYMSVMDISELKI